MSATRMLSCILAILLILFYFSSCSIRRKLSEIIISDIDQTCDENGYCMIDLIKMIDFKWDRAAFFEHSCSSETIANTLGIDYYKSYDYNQIGMIFVYQNKIVYEEIITLNVSSPPYNRFSIRVFDNKSYPNKCELVMPDNAVFYATRNSYDGKYYYAIERDERIKEWSSP